MARRVQHSHRAAKQRHGVRRQRRERHIQIEAAALVAGMNLEPIAVQRRELIQISGIAA